jgi:hypothetical protein
VQSGEALRKTFFEYIFFGDRSASVDLVRNIPKLTPTISFTDSYQGAPSGAPPRINKPNRGFSR